MYHFFHSILKSNEILFRRIWHMLAILLVMVSNFGSLTYPVNAKAVVNSEAKQHKQIEPPKPGRIAQPVTRIIESKPQQSTGCTTSGTLIIAAGETCSLPFGSYSFENITIQSGGTLSLAGDPSTGVGVTIHATTITIEGVMSANGQGYTDTDAIGGGPGGGIGSNSGGCVAGGGGYGAPGGSGSGCWGGGLSGGGVYGSISEPQDLGSADGFSNAYGWRYGGSGGGAIRLIVDDTLTVNGVLSANGTSVGQLTAGGSGGSLWITANNLVGNGIIQANGGSTSGDGGGGGGGRIALYYVTNEMTLGADHIQAYGGSGYGSGGPGTIYMGVTDPTRSSIQISPTEITVEDTNCAMASVTLLNSNDQPLANKPVEIMLASGSGLDINGQSVSGGEYILIGTTNSNGVVTAQLKTTIAGTRTIKARSGQVSLNGTGTVEFIPGAVSPSHSKMEIDQTNLPANGQTAAVITVTALDQYDNPAQGVNVQMSATGSANITPLSTATDGQGKTTSKITDTAIETVTVSASVNGADLSSYQQIQFHGSDLVVTQGASAETNQGLSHDHATAGHSITYTLTVQNNGLMTASGVTLTDILPGGFMFTSQDSAFDFTQAGQTLTWNIGDLGVGAGTTINLVASIPQSALGEVTNMATATVDATSLLYEENSANNTSQLKTIVDAPAPALRIVSSRPVVQGQPGKTSMAQIEIRNDGLGSTGVIGITLSDYLGEWVTITPNSIALLTPGESKIVTLTANPTSQSYGVYQGRIRVTDGKLVNGQMGEDNQLAVVQVIPGQRTLVVTVKDNQGQVLPGAVMWLQNTAAYTKVDTNGDSSTYYPSYTGTADVNGLITFSNINLGNYEYRLSAVYHDENDGNMVIESGDGSQIAEVVLTAKPGLYANPTSLTLVAAAGEQASQAVQVKNTGAAALENVRIELSGLPDWVQIVQTEGMTKLDAQEQAEFEIFASPPAGIIAGWLTGSIVVTGSGLSQPVSVSVSIDVLADANARRDVQFNLVDQGASLIPSGAQVIVKRVKPATMTINGQSISYQPQFSQQVGEDGSALFTGNESLEIGEKYSYQAWGDKYQVSQGTFMVNPPDLEQAQASAQNQTVVLQADHFIYTWTVTEIPGGVNLSYDIKVKITYADGLPAPQPGWCTGMCEWKSGEAHWPVNSSGGGGFGTTLPSNLALPPIRYSQMYLSQTVMLTGQAFLANLWLKNTSALSLDDMSAQVMIVDGQGVDQTANFVFQSPARAGFGNLGRNEEDSSDWVIIPKGTGINELTGYWVYAQISYKQDGESYSYPTIPQWIVVRPAPSLSIQYEIPDSKVLCQEFDIRATIINNGYGMAENLRINSLHPISEDKTTSFRIISAKVDGVARPGPLDINLGNVGPGGSTIVVWRIHASKPVYLGTADASFEHNGAAGEVVQAIRSVTVKKTPALCELAAIAGVSTYCPDGCGAASAAHNYVAVSLDTQTGNFSYPTNDLSVSTADGSLSFRHTYVSEATEKYTGVMGSGWTHNQDIRLVFPTNPAGQEGYVLFKDHSGNMYLFLDNQNGTYTPYHGVTASLVKNGTTPVTYTLLDTSKTTYVFAENGQVQSITDANGKAFNYSYDETGKLERVAAADEDRYLQFSYQDGNLKSVADQAGRQVSFSYDGDGNLASTTDLLGKTWLYKYDNANHQLTRILDPNEKVFVRNEYDAQGRVQKQYNGNGDLVAELAYLSDGSTQVKDGLGQTEVNTYNQLGTLIGDQNISGDVTSKVYDRNFRPTAITDALGNPTNLAWSADGADLTSFTDAAGNLTTITYINHKPHVITDSSHNTTTYEYEGDLLKSVTTEGKTTTYHYYAEAPLTGLIETVTDPGGQVTRYEYDEHGQKTKIIANFSPTHGENEAGLYNLTTKYQYDDFGQVTDIFTPTGKSDPAWLVTHSEYDAAGRLITTIQNYAPGRSQNDENLYNLTTRYYYDVRGNQIASEDTYGNVTRTYYDDAGRVVAVVRNLVGAIESETIPERGSGGTAKNLRTDNTYDAAGNLIATQDEKGVITRTYTDAPNHTVTVVRNLQGQDVNVSTPPAYNQVKPDENVRSQTVSDANGNIIASIDNSGVITRTYYDEMNRPKLVVQNLVGQGIDINTPPSCGQVDTNLCTYTYYDTGGNVIATKDPMGIITRTYYDELNRPTRVVQNLTGQDIESSSLPTCGQVDENLCTDTIYDDSGRVIATQDPQGHITRTWYDAAGRAVTVVRNLTGYAINVGEPPARNSGQSDENIRMDTIYDTGGRPLFKIDPLGHQVKYEYDLLGRVWKTILNPLDGQPQNYQNTTTGEYYNLVTTSSYDALGRTVTTTDTVGRVSLTQYDDQTGLVLFNVQNFLAGQGWNYQNQYNLKTSYSYDGFGQQIAVTDTEGSVTRNYFDGLGRTRYVVRNLSNWDINNPVPPDGQTDNEVNLRSETVYWQNGQVWQTVAEDGKVTEYGYDVFGRQTSLKLPALPASYSTYDAAGRLVDSTASNGVVTHYGYDDLGRLTDVWENYREGITPDAKNNVHTQYTYDANGNRRTIKDGNGHVTVFDYDGLGHLKTETDALGHSWAYSYDKNGNKVSLLDANGANTNYRYSFQGQLIAIDYPGSDIDVTFSYDALGRRTGMNDGLGQTTWNNYSALNQPASITDPFGKTVGYEYGAFGNRASLTYPDSGKVVSYGFDLAHRISAVAQGGSPVATYLYDMLGRVSTTTPANGVTTQYSYNAAGQLEGIVHRKGSQELASYQYQYDDSGNRSQVTETVLSPDMIISGNAGVGGATVTYTTGSTTAGNDGNYSFTVPYGWTGTITPSKAGYTFTPASIAITAPITDNLPNQNFTAAPNDLLISGKAGVAGATLSYVDGVTKTATAGNDGNYSFTVPYGWTGTITPSKAGYTFTPVSIVINSPVLGNLPNQDFTALRSAKADFNGDGKTDIALFRPSSGFWHIKEESYWFYGIAGDIPVSGDYDGDGKTDIAVFRNGVWYVKDQGYWGYGIANDIPVPGDYNGDDKTDIAVFRNGMWYVKDQFAVGYGMAGDIPVPGDYNGDGKTDIAVFRDGAWYVKDQGYWSHGMTGDIPVPGDYNGDGTTDIAVFRPSNGFWYIKDQGYWSHGMTGDIPAPGDYNGDGKTDIAVFRSSNGFWYIKDQGYWSYGIAGDIPVPGDYNGDGKTDIAVFRNGVWYAKDRFTGGYGMAGDIPVSDDYNGDGKTDIAVFRNGVWYVKDQFAEGYGMVGDIPVPGDYNGDGKIDVAVFRNGVWYVKDQFAEGYGIAGDIPIPGDYDGDGKTDIAVFRDGVWYVKDQGYWSYGIAGDIPVPGDYNGDGKTDIAVFRNGAWYVKDQGYWSYGIAGDIPVPGDYNGDGKTDIAVFRDGAWYVKNQFMISYGTAGDWPLAASDALRAYTVYNTHRANGAGSIVSYASGSAAVDSTDNFPTHSVAPSEVAVSSSTATEPMALTGTPVSQGSQSLKAEPTVTATTTITPVTIDYKYDPLNRLTKATYPAGRTYEYEYDAVGNRTKQKITIDGQSSVINYQYDDANRLISVNGVAYTYDDNGNLLSDGANTYTYDAANRLNTVTSSQGAVTSYQYNGLGDRLKETVNGVTTTFIMDLNFGLPQILSDGTYDYLYGNGRVAQTNPTTTEYFLTDTLGSVRQLTDATGAVTLAKAYDPYGVVSMTSGSVSSSYGFSGEQQDSSGMVYLRARYYTPSVGRFLTRDTWDGDANRPMSYNRWMYAYGNPIVWADPTGMKPKASSAECFVLAGSTDRLKCERIIRGFDPRDGYGPSDSELIMYDLDPECFNYRIFSLPQFRPAWKTLPAPSGDNYELYGFWFHYLINEKSIRKHGYRTSIGMALSIVASNEAHVDSLYSQVSQPIANAMILKGRARGMYVALGSRQATIKNVESGILFMGNIAIPQRNWDFCNRGAGVDHCYKSFEQLIKAYNPLKLEYQDMPGKIAAAFGAYPSAPSNRDDAPDDWGNVTLFTTNLPKNPNHTPPMNIMDVLKRTRTLGDRFDLDPWSVAWYSPWSGANYDGTGQFFIRTPRQATNLCPPAGDCIGQ